MNVVGTGGAASLLVPTQPQAQATRSARSTMASTLKGGRGHNVLQALADNQCAPPIRMVPNPCQKPLWQM